MSGGVIKISYKKWDFAEPRILNEREYSDINHQLKENPEIDITPNTWNNFQQEMRIDFYWFLIVIFGIGFCVFAETYLSQKFLYNICELVGVILLLIGFYSALQLFLSGLSYWSFTFAKNGYYWRLKKAILATGNYADFVSYFNATK